MNYRDKMYKDFPTYREVLESFNEFKEQIRHITTIQQAQDWLDKNKGNIVEINGEEIKYYIEHKGTDEDIDWIRYEHHDDLYYLYCYIRDGEVKSIRFDIWSRAIQDDFATDIEVGNYKCGRQVFTQEEYYNFIQKAVESDFYGGEDYRGEKLEFIGYDMEVLPSIYF